MGMAVAWPLVRRQPSLRRGSGLADGCSRGLGASSCWKSACSMLSCSAVSERTKEAALCMHVRECGAVCACSLRAVCVQCMQCTFSAHAVHMHVRCTCTCGAHVVTCTCNMQCTCTCDAHAMHIRCTCTCSARATCGTHTMHIRCTYDAHTMHIRCTYTYDAHAHAHAHAHAPCTMHMHMHMHMHMPCSGHAWRRAPCGECAAVAAVAQQRVEARQGVPRGGCGLA